MGRTKCEVEEDVPDPVVESPVSVVRDGEVRDRS